MRKTVHPVGYERLLEAADEIKTETVEMDLVDQPLTPVVQTGLDSAVKGVVVVTEELGVGDDLV